MSRRKETSAYRYWSDAEIQRLSDLSQKHSAQEVADILGRSLKSVKQAALIRCFSFRKNPRKPYSAHDDHYIRDHVGVQTLGDIAQHLGRTRESIKSRVKRLGLSRTYSPVFPKKYSDEDVELCRQLHDAGLTCSEISEKMEIPKESVRQYVMYEARLNNLPDFVYDISELR